MIPAVNTKVFIERTYDNAVQYKPGVFCHYKENESGMTTFSSPPSAPKKAWSQRALIYRGNPQAFKQEKVLRKIIPDTDGRVRISNTAELPYSIHVQLSIRFLGTEYGGSGCLVGPHHVLTCGHNVYDDEKRIWAEAILVHPALNKSCAPFGVIGVVKAYTFTNWTNNGDKRFDIALLVLNRSIGKYTGWGGIWSTHDSELINQKVHITGYPGDKNFDEMWSMSHELQALYPEKFDYLIDTHGGQSGSAIWVSKCALPMIIGVHTVGSDIMNSGVRISAQKFANFFIKIISETRKIEKTVTFSVPPPENQYSLQPRYPSPNPFLQHSQNSPISHDQQLKTFQMPLYTTQTTTPIIHQPVPITIPSIAFGKYKWMTHFGDVGDEPPLPNNIHEILQDYTPIFPGKTVENSHVLVLIPATINGYPFNLKILSELIKKPKKGASACFQISSEVLDSLPNVPVRKSYWVLMTRDIMEEGRGRSFEILREETANLAQKTGFPYSIPKMLEAATCILMHHVHTGEQLYSSETPEQGAYHIVYHSSSTVCQEEIDVFGGRGRRIIKQHLCIGSFNKRNRELSTKGFSENNFGRIGIGPCYRLT